jgi:hypothetical protein
MSKDLGFIEEYKGFEIFVEPGRQRLIAFPVGAQVSECMGESLDDIHMAIDELT